MSAPKAKRHCFHHLGVTYTSYPPQWDERCCFCGLVVRVHQAPRRPKGHGALADSEWWSVYPADAKTSCPGSASQQRERE